MKLRTTSLLAALFVLPLLFISTSTRHHIMPMSGAMNGAANTKINDCVGACGNQHQPTVTAINERKIEKEKEPKPQPAEPYYLQFLKFAPYIEIVTAAYLLRHLRWRLPDLIVLYGTYRT